MVKERRAGLRVSTDEGGKVFCFRSPVLPCRVIELSERGARLVFGGELPMSDDVMLVMEDLGRIEVATVRWRRDRTLGIEFRSDPDRLPFGFSS
jgi:hypothetical protein